MSKDYYKDFLLAHYKQINEHLREVDRRRDILFGAYVTLLIGAISTVFTKGLSIGIRVLVLMVAFGIGLLIAIAVTRFRAWHADYTNVAMAIHKVFLDDKLTLLGAAEELKNDERFCKYFSPGGVEFMMMIITMVSLSLPVIAIYFTLYDWIMKTQLPLVQFIFLEAVLIGIPVTWVLLFWYYRFYLSRREKEFPRKSWCIFEAPMHAGEIKNKKGRKGGAS